MSGLQQTPASPCMGCEEREVGCHSHCIAYKKWKAKYRDRKENGYERKHHESGSIRGNKKSV